MPISRFKLGDSVLASVECGAFPGSLATFVLEEGGEDEREDGNMCVLYCCCRCRCLSTGLVAVVEMGGQRCALHAIDLVAVHRMCP